MACAPATVVGRGAQCIALAEGTSQGQLLAKWPACVSPITCFFHKQSVQQPSPPRSSAFLRGGRKTHLDRRVRVVRDVFDELDLVEDETDFDAELDDAEFVLPRDLEDRPLAKGFGQGRTYDTSLEDELMNEIESTRQGFTKKKQGGDAPIPQQMEGGAARKKRAPPTPPEEHKGSFPWLLRGTPEDRYPPNTPAGVKVTVGNLPKKKKVGKDLRKALIAVPGLLVIRPSEIGDRNTRDCTCKGAATLIFKDEQYALGFCTGFQGRPIQFGKIERRITAKLADTRQQAPRISKEREEEEREENEPAESDVDQLIEEGQEKGMEQLQRQNELEEAHGRTALLEGTPQVEERELQQANVKLPEKKEASASGEPDSVDETIEQGKEAGQKQLQKQRRKEESGGKGSLLGKPVDETLREGEDGRSDALSNNENELGTGKGDLKQGDPSLRMSLSSKGVLVQGTSGESDFVDEAIEEGKEAGQRQLQKQRRKEESGGKGSLLGRPAEKRSKEGEDGRSDALSNNENELRKRKGDRKQGDPPVGMSLAKAVAVQETSGGSEYGDVNIDALFDEEDLLDEALDEELEGASEGGEEDDEENWEDAEYELEVSDFFPGSETPPRSSKITRVLEDGTLIVRGQTVGKVDPSAAKNGQLAVPADVAARIDAVTKGQPVEVDMVTSEALAAKRAFEEKLVAWHFGQLPGFEPAERPSKEDVRVTWDAANRTMVKVGGFSKAKHKRLKAEQREPQNVQELLHERTSRNGSSEEDTEEEEEEWELEEESNGEEEAEPGSRTEAANRVVSKVAHMDFEELLAAEKRELAEGIERLRAQNKAIPTPSQEVLDTIERLKTDPRSLDEMDNEDDDTSAGTMGSRKSSATKVSSQRRQEGARGGQESTVSEERSKKGGSKTRKASSKPQQKLEYRELMASIQKGS